MHIDSTLLIEKYGLMVTRLAHRMINDSEVAKDAVQESWYEIIKSLHTFKGNSEISTWIFCIAKRTILRYSKNEKIVTKTDIEECIKKGQIKYDDSEEKKEEWIKDKCDKCLTAFCHCLNNDARLIFLFKENFDISYKQISDIMEMTEENVRKISSRSFKRVKNFLTDNCPLINPLGTCGCRIKEQIFSIDYEKKYAQWREVTRLIHFYNQFDKELPRKNEWEKFLKEAVTN